MNKKILFLSILLFLLGLTFSGCSYKKDLFIDNNTSSTTSYKKVLSTTPSSTTKIIKPKALLTAVKSEFGPRRFKCSDGPVKLSNISEGDYFDSYKISKLNYTTSDNGRLLGLGYELDGEQTFIGHISVSFEYGSRIWFEPEKPILEFYYTETSGLVYAECNKTSFSLNTTEDSGCETMLNEKGDFIGLEKCSFKSSDKLPNFNNFWVTAKDKDNYPKKVIIKVNNFSSGFRVGGEGGTSATLVDIIKVID